MIEVEAPDGTIVEFPDGTPRDVMAGAMRKRFGGPQAPAVPAAPATPAPSGADLDMMMRGQAATPVEPPKPLTTMDRVRGVAGEAWATVDQGVRGAARGAVGLAGLPVDAATWVLNRHPVINAIGQAFGGTGQITNPVGGSEFNKNLLDTLNERTTDAANLIPGVNVGYPNKVPDGALQQSANRIGEEIGAAAVPIGAALNTAGRLGREGVKQLPSFVRNFVEPFAVAPNRTIVKEGMSAAAAGSGAAIANQFSRASGSKEGDLGYAAADIGGALGGAGTLGIARAVGPKIADVFNALRGDPNFSNRVVRETVVDKIADAYGLPSAREGGQDATDVTPIVDAIANGRRVADTVPGYQESLADRTQNPGLAGVEYSRQTGENGGTWIRRAQENNEAINDALQANAPTGSPGAFRDQLADRRAGLFAGAATDRQAAQTRFDDAAARLQTAMHADARGADIRAPLEDALGAARGVERAAWEGIEGQLPAAPLAQRFARIGGAMTEPEQRIVGDLAGAIGTPGRLAPAQPVGDPLSAMTGRGLPPVGEDATDLRQITSLRSEFTTAQRQAATQGDTNKARLIGQYIDAIDTHLAEHAPEAQDALDAARAVSLDLNNRFTRPQSAIGQTLAVQQGRPRVLDNAVPGKFVQPDSGRVEDFEALMREAGNDPRALGAIRDQVLEEVGRRRTPEQIEAFVREHSRVLDRFPDLRAQVQEAVELRRSADSATQRETDLTRSLGTENTRGSTAVGQYLHYSNEKSSQAMKNVLSSAKPGEAVNELLEFAGNAPEAVEGARRTFWNVLEERSRSAGESTATARGTQPWMPAKLKRFLDDPSASAVAERLYRDDPEHLANVRQIADALQGVNLKQRMRAQNTSGTAQGMSQVMSPETLQSRAYAYQRGQISGTFLVTSIAAVASRRAVRGAQTVAVGRLLDEALLNPEAAATLLRENNPVNRAILRRNAKAWMGNEASTLVDALDEEDEDPVKAAATRKPLELRVQPGARQ